MRRATVSKLPLLVALLCAVPVAYSGSAWDSGPYDNLLRAYVIDGLVAYDRLVNNPLLARCAQTLADARPDRMATDADRLAFWINAYNFSVIASVVRAGIPERAIDIPGFFTQNRHDVAGRRLTLDQMQRDLIRPARDPRVYCALVNGSLSSPRLQPWPYAGDRLDEQLTRACRDFIADGALNRIEVDRRQVLLSRIFQWYRPDFVAAYGSVVAFLRRYGPASFADVGSVESRYMTYDWTLNRYGGRR